MELTAYMNPNLLMASAAVFLMLSSYLALKLKSELNEKREIQTQFIEVDKHRKNYNSTLNEYRLLQTTYGKKKSEFDEYNRILNHHQLGIGTVDTVVYERTTDYSQLDKLQAALANTVSEKKEMVKRKTACICSLGNDVRVNDSKAEATKLKNREIKLRLRCFDNELKSAIAVANWNNISRLVERVIASCDDINDRGKTVKTQISPDYCLLSLNELKLTYEIKQLQTDLKEEEREEQRIIREAEREEARLKAALTKATADRERMEKLVQQELAKLNEATEEQRALLDLHQSELAELQQRETRAKSMAQQTKAGYVYIISNTQSFERSMIKIGMTRRVDPYDRVHELGDASVPDSFDVHALFYCEDAPTLESALHRQFDQQRVNMVNRRKEFFLVEPKIAIHTVESLPIEIQRIV